MARDTDLYITYTAAIAARTNARLERYRIGKRSGRSRLNQTINLALDRLLDDLDAKRVDLPDWAYTKPRARSAASCG